MQKLLAFILHYRVFFWFVALEIFCFWLIFSVNDYQRVVFLNSTNSVSASILEKRQSVFDYFNLSEKNAKIMAENAKLKEMLMRESVQKKDIYRVYSSKVVNNSIHYKNNYITINSGKRDGIEVGMGVLSGDGIVGSVVSCNENYSLIASILHSQTLVSAKIKRSGTLGSLVWSGESQKIFNLKYIPRHIKVQKGDTVITSGYNSTYPEGEMIGTIQSIKLRDNSSFYEIDVLLTNNISDLDYVYVVENKNKDEIKQLEQLQDYAK